jgi:uncharacterized protein YkwD
MTFKSMLVSCLLAAGLLMTSGGHLLAAPAMGGARPLARATSASSWKPSSEACTFLSIINSYRAKSGLVPLTISLTLGASAEDHSRDMASNDYFDHTLSSGISWSDNITNHGYPKATVRAENIAAGRASASDVFDQWRNSKGHNANMLGSKFRAIGIARSENADSTFTWYWTTTFGSTVDKPYSCPGRTTSASISDTYAIVGSGRSSNSTSSLAAFDGDLGTSWHSTSDSPAVAYVYFDLGSSSSISKVKWYFSRNGSADSYQIQISSDKSSWTTVATRRSASADTWQSLSVGKNARYVRFYFKNPHDDATLGYLADVKIYR